MSALGRREFLKATGGAAAAISLAPGQAFGGPPARPPNLVYVFTDQHRVQAMGFMEEDPVTTPNLDAFAAKNFEGLPAETAFLEGRPFVEIIRYAREKDIQLIVIATHGRTGIKHALFGSVAEKVVRKAPCPVLVVKRDERDFVMP